MISQILASIFDNNWLWENETDQFYYGGTGYLIELKMINCIYKGEILTVAID